MRRIGFVTIGIVLVVSGVALAASYKTGLYSAGFPSTHAAGIDITMHKGSFAVHDMSFRERCTSSKGSFTDYFEFVAGAHAKLTGKIDGHGKFSGEWVSASGTDKVSGTVTGSKANVTGSENTTYQPNANAPVYTCQGSATFHATRLQTTGG
jgi:hypothetical protein